MTTSVKSQREVPDRCSTNCAQEIKYQKRRPPARRCAGRRDRFNP